jgi:serine/threonine protein kinase
LSISINRKIEKHLGELAINPSLLLKFKGGSTDSSVWRHCDKIIKIWNQSNFNLQILARTLANIHKFLSCAHLVPKLDSLSFATDNHLIGIFEYLEPCEERFDPEAVGMTLAKVHLALETVPIGGTLSWVGFYGEYDEFKFLTPYVTDNSIKEVANFLLPYCKFRTHTDFIHYLHRDLNPTNIIYQPNHIRFIDWDMAYPGFREDDVAMSLICLLDNCANGDEIVWANKFLFGYQKIFPQSWVSLQSEILRAAIAVSGLRQAVAGWYTDQGDTTAGYWINIRHRINVAALLL